MTLVTHVRYIDDVKLKVLLCVSTHRGSYPQSPPAFNVTQHIMDHVMCDGLPQTNIMAGHPTNPGTAECFVEWAVFSCG